MVLIKTCPAFQSACIFDRCAWWDEEKDNCAVVGLLKSSRQMEKILTDVMLEAVSEKKPVKARKSALAN